MSWLRASKGEKGKGGYLGGEGIITPDGGRDEGNMFSLSGRNRSLEDPLKEERGWTRKPKNVWRRHQRTPQIPRAPKTKEEPIKVERSTQWKRKFIKAWGEDPGEGGREMRRFFQQALPAKNEGRKQQAGRKASQGARNAQRDANSKTDEVSISRAAGGRKGKDTRGGGGVSLGKWAILIR